MTKEQRIYTAIIRNLCHVRCIIIVQVICINWCTDDFLDSMIVITHEIVVPRGLTKSIFVTLSLSGFIEPDFVKREWLVNYITNSFVELFVSIEITLALKKALANSFEIRFINTCAIHCFEEVIENNMELGWGEISEHMSKNGLLRRVFV
jgi:hypothetical protein